MKRVITLTESELIKLVRKVIKEENGEKSVVYYNKCEGGQGLVEPESFKFLDKREKYIKFIKQPDPNYDNGNSSSIGKCLGFGEPMENTCYEILEKNGKKIAYYGIDCKTKERW
jgi:hypothetical protein